MRNNSTLSKQGLIINVHPGYSIDALPHNIENYCEKGVQLGLTEICFTTHLEVDPHRKHIDWFVRCNNQIIKMNDLTWLDHYFHELSLAQSKYRPGLSVKAGIEVGFEPDQEKYIDRILSSYPFDFVLGSVHCLNHIAISSRKECSRYFAGKSDTHVAGDYFKKLDQAVKTNLFDGIAHIDLYRRYGLAYLKNVDYLHCGYIESIFVYMARNNIALEINTSGLRRGLGDLHPSELLLKAAVENDIELYTIGSDAHSVGELGQGLDQAEDLLKKFSLNASPYSKRKPIK